MNKNRYKRLHITDKNPDAGRYRYGFNGKENDIEAMGEGKQQDYGMRIYNPRVGRFLSVDPITAQYPELTPYQFASNRPIDGIDRDGLEWYYYNDLEGWVESKHFEPPIIYENYESVANKLGYYSAAQVHKILDAKKQREDQAALKQKYKDYNEAMLGLARSRNFFLMWYDISPIPALVDAGKYTYDGEYGAAVVMGIAGAVDLGPLFRTVGKAYGRVARSIASQFTIEGIWKLGSWTRGKLLEVRIADNYISKGFEWLAETTSPFFKTIDFFNFKSGVAVSFKTTNAETYSGILKNIDHLVEMKKAEWSVIGGRERRIKGVKLHILVPKGFDKSKLKGVVEYADVKLGEGNVEISTLE